MENKGSLTSPRYYRHAILGICLYSEACEKLEEANYDNSSVFMEIGGEAIEVSLRLIRRVNQVSAELDYKDKMHL